MIIFTRFISLTFIASCAFSSYAMLRLPKSLTCGQQHLNKKQDLLQTQLRKAIEGGHSNLVELALKRGARVDMPDKSDLFEDYPLHTAATGDRLDIAQLLVRRGAGLETLNSLRRTPLWEATVSDTSNLVLGFLISEGANREHKNHCKATPVMGAAFLGAYDNVTLLCNEGVEVNAQDMHGQTALMYAVSSSSARIKRAAIAQQLIQKYGADMNVQDHNRQTALIKAVRSNNIAAAHVLCELGAAKSIRDDWGDTAYDKVAKELMARKLRRDSFGEKQEEMIRVLEELLPKLR